MAAASQWVMLLACVVTVLCLGVQISLSFGEEPRVEHPPVPQCIARPDDDERGKGGDVAVEEPPIELVRLREVIMGAREESSGRRLVRKRKTWYSNGIVETAEEAAAIPFDCEAEGSMRLAVGDRMIELANPIQAAPIGITWPANDILRETLMQTDLRGVPIVHSSSSVVLGAIIGDIPQTSGSKVLLAEMLCTEQAAALLLEILTEPFPYWAAELRWAFADDQHTIDMDTVHMAFYRTEAHHYELVHVLNPYTPKAGSEPAVELSVVRESLRRAYNKAWSQGIRVKIVACVFEEDEGMIEYPYTPASSYLKRSFVDSLGRKVPVMTDMLNIAWEEGGAISDFFVWTNVDIAALPDLYIHIWKKYADYDRTASLLREQLDLEDIDIWSWPLEMESLYLSAKTIGHSHTGDDCVVLPSTWLTRIDYGMVFPAYPPVACTLIDQAFFYGLVAKFRARDTFHLGLDTTSAWRKNLDTVIGRHLNMMGALDVFSRLRNERFYYLNPNGHCYLTNWCSGRADLQMPKLLDEEEAGYEAALQCEVKTNAPLEDHWRPQVPNYVFGRTGLFPEFAPEHAVSSPRQ